VSKKTFRIVKECWGILVQKPFLLILAHGMAIFYGVSIGTSSSRALLLVLFTLSIITSADFSTRLVSNMAFRGATLHPDEVKLGHRWLCIFFAVTILLTVGVALLLRHLIFG
jgi:hypothetical protein